MDGMLGGDVGPDLYNRVSNRNGGSATQHVCLPAISFPSRDGEGVTLYGFHSHSPSFFFNSTIITGTVGGRWASLSLSICRFLVPQVLGPGLLCCGCGCYQLAGTTLLYLVYTPPFSFAVPIVALNLTIILNGPNFEISNS